MKLTQKTKPERGGSALQPRLSGAFSEGSKGHDFVFRYTLTYTDLYSICVCLDRRIHTTYRPCVKEYDFEIGKCGHHTQKNRKEERVTTALWVGETEPF